MHSKEIILKLQKRAHCQQTVTPSDHLLNDRIIGREGGHFAYVIKISANTTVRNVIRKIFPYIAFTSFPKTKE